MAKDGDMRMLGAVDGFVHALMDVRQQIRTLDGNYAPRILPHHRQKRAARDAILRPLKELEAKFAKYHEETRAAYQRTTE